MGTLGGHGGRLYEVWEAYGDLNIACHVRSKIMFCAIFKVKVKVEVTSTTSKVIMFRPGMAGLLALSRLKFHFKNVIFDQIHNF